MVCRKAIWAYCVLSKKGSKVNSDAVVKNTNTVLATKVESDSQEFHRHRVINDSNIAGDACPNLEVNHACTAFDKVGGGFVSKSSGCNV